MDWWNKLRVSRSDFLQKYPRAPLVSLLVLAAMVMLIVDLAAPAIRPIAQFALDVAVFVLFAPFIVRFTVEQDARLRRESAAAQEAALVEDRRVLARDLHDSIAQHLCYLHLKFDELAEQHRLVATSALSGELEQMREVANQAYEDIYCLMSSLRPSPSGDLIDALQARAALARQRAGFDTRVIQTGEPRKLQSCYEQEIALVVREALTNIEKHAHARVVDIAINWSGDTLGITVRDDGEGFDAAHNGAPGHFGLDIMKERTAEMGGKVRLRSQPGRGTLVEISLPLANLVDSDAQPCA